MKKFMIQAAYEEGGDARTIEAYTDAEALAKWVAERECGERETECFEGDYEVHVEVWTPKPLNPEQHPNTPPLHSRTLVRNFHVEKRDGKIVYITVGDQEPVLA